MDKQENPVRSLVGLTFILLVVGQLINAQQHTYINRFLTIVTVPTIFFTVGYFFNKTKSFRFFLLDGIKKYVVPYAVASMVVIVMNKIATRLTEINRPFPDTRTIIKTFGYGIGWPTNTLFGQSSFGVGLVWLLLAIFLATIIFKIITQLEKNWLIVVAVILVTALGYWFRIIVQLPWSLEAAMIAQPFIYFGFLIKKYQSMPMSIATFFVGIIMWFVSAINGTFDFIVAYNPHPIFGTIASLFAISVVYVLHDKIIYPIKPLQKILGYLGNHLILGITVTMLVVFFIRANGGMSIFYRAIILMISVVIVAEILKKLTELIKQMISRG